MFFSKVSGHPFAKSEGTSEKYPGNSAGNTFLDQHFNPLPLPGASELIYPDSVFLGSLSYLFPAGHKHGLRSQKAWVWLSSVPWMSCDLQQITKLSELHSSLF